MQADIYWVTKVGNGRLALLARPRPGDWIEEEIADWQRQGIAVAVSLLEPIEAAGLGLERESELCKANGISFVSFPIPDYGIPSSSPAVQELASGLANRLAAGEAVGIHCRGGVGRSAVIGACTLIAAGYDAESALDLISRARGVEVPETEAQRRFVLEFRMP
jgi:protein-tyrosine phosphatase